MGRYVYVKVFKDYGKIVLTVDKVLKRKKINIYRLSRLTGISWGVIQKYKEGNLYRVDLDLLSRMCFALNCQLEELIHYECVEGNRQKKKLKERRNKALNK